MRRFWEWRLERLMAIREETRWYLVVSEAGRADRYTLEDLEAEIGRLDKKLDKVEARLA